VPGQFRHDSVVAAAADQVSADLADQAAILNLKSGVYYGLDTVGASIWRLIRESRTIAEIESALLAEYEVDATQCATDLRGFIERLVAEGLVEVKTPSVPE
jgi:hypothetical protein